MIFPKEKLVVTWSATNNFFHFSLLLAGVLMAVLFMRISSVYTVMVGVVVESVFLASAVGSSFVYTLGDHTFFLGKNHIGNTSQWMQEGLFFSKKTWKYCDGVLKYFTMFA
jgi:hypothetical protein